MAEKTKGSRKSGKHDHKADSGARKEQIYQGYDAQETIEKRYRRPWFWKVLGISLVITVIIIGGVLGALFMRNHKTVAQVNDINTANTMETLLEGHDNVEMVCSYLNTDSGESYTTTRQFKMDDDDYYAYLKIEGSSNDYKEVIDNQELYRYDGKFITSYGLIGSDYEDTVLPSVSDSIYQLPDNTTISSEKENGQYVKLKASCRVTDGDRYTQEFGLQAGDTVEITIAMNKDTSVITSVTESFDDEDIYTYIISFDAKERVPQFYKDMKKTTETRTCTVYHNYGSSKEKTYKFEIPQDTYFNLLDHEGYTVYADKACETEFTEYQMEIQNPEGALTLYVKKDGGVTSDTSDEADTSDSESAAAAEDESEETTTEASDSSDEDEDTDTEEDGIDFSE